MQVYIHDQDVVHKLPNSSFPQVVLDISGGGSKFRICFPQANTFSMSSSKLLHAHGPFNAKKSLRSSDVFVAEHHAPGEHLLRGPLQEAGGPDHSDPGHHCGLDVHCGGLGVAPGALGLRVWAGGGFGRVAGLGGGVGGSPRNSEPHFVERSTVGLGCWVWYWLGLRAVRVGSRECPLSSTAVVPLADLRGPGLRFALLPYRVAGAVPARLEHDRLLAGADPGRLGRPAGRATKLRQLDGWPQISLTNSEYALTKNP